MPNKKSSLEELETIIGYQFSNSSLLQQSLTHPSYFHDHNSLGEHNQRLEFLGDAILSAILAEQLYALFPREREGVLSSNRSALSKGPFLAELALKLQINRFLRLSRSEVLNGGNERESILEDALEALIGAIFLDSDYPTTRSVVLVWFDDIKRTLSENTDYHNPKGRLQEMVQPHLGNEAVQYNVTHESGPDHEKTFEVQVLINGIPHGLGQGSSKKEAEENAALATLANELDILSTC